MGVYKAKNGRFFIKFDFQGVSYKKRLPENMTKKKAKELETNWKHRLFYEANGIEQKRQITFESFLFEYFEPFCKANHCYGSLRRDKEVCQDALPFFKGKMLRAIKPADIENYKTYRSNLPTPKLAKRKPATLARDLSVLSKLFSLAVKNDFLDYNPVSRIEKPKFDNLQNEILRREDEEAYFKAFKSAWAKEVCILVLNTGLRQNDALSLTKFNIDWNNKLIRLTQGKTGRKVNIPMNATVQALIRDKWSQTEELLFPSPVTGKQGLSVQRACIGASARSKIGMNITIKDLRRTFGTRLDELNYSSSVKAKLLGHGDLRSVHRYERGSDILREAVEALEPNRTNIVPVSFGTGNKS